MVINIRGDVTPIMAQEVRDTLTNNAGPYEVHIDSPGGDLFAGLDIFNMLSGVDTTIYIDGLAGSVSSVIAMSGKGKPSISETGSIAIHNAHTENIKGNQHDLTRVAESLQKYSDIVAQVYHKKTGISVDDLTTLMDNETVFNSAGAIKAGFAGDLFNPIKAFAKININNINMGLLEVVKNNLGLSEVPVVENVDAAPVPEEAPAGEAFNPDQIAAIEAIVADMIAQAMAGTEAEIGNTVATVLNSVVSKGSPDTIKNAVDTEGTAPVDGVTAFYKRMNEIKNQPK
jgi:ATP-dependent protease ClpP protease subunit